MKDLGRIRQIKNHDNSPNNMGVDSDTVLQDVLDEMPRETTGLAHELFDLYEAGDKATFEGLFEAITGTKFIDYLYQCPVRGE